MTHTPAHCPKCIINGGFVASAADLYATLTSSAAALKLADVAASAQAINQHAMAVGLIPKPEPRGEWSGCDEATEIMSWVASNLRGDKPSKEETETHNKKMAEWASMYADAALDVVSGEPMREHPHAHSRGEGSDLLGK